MLQLEPHHICYWLLLCALVRVVYDVLRVMQCRMLRPAAHVVKGSCYNSVPYKPLLARRGSGPTQLPHRAIMIDTPTMPLLPAERPRPVADKPVFHVAPKSGWINDPNGPIYYDGRYHMFYQYVPGSAEWSFGLVWGHAVSKDLVTWEHLPTAVAPSQSFKDADGCFSGCAAVDMDGTPTLLYTGVRLRTNADCGPLPPPAQDLQLPFIESQLVAVASPGDDANLIQWQKSSKPLVELPPVGLGELAGWRDPFIVSRPGQMGCDEWVMLVGSGIKEVGGTVLVYKSSSLTKGWRFDGELCKGTSETGIMWECPSLIQLNRKDAAPGTADSASPVHMMCVSPDSCKNPVLYWLGGYANARFDLETAAGPFKMDLGDSMYAPNIMTDGQGRHLLWGWMQEQAERRPAGKHDYSGCLTTPRVLTLEAGRLHQAPAPEVAALRGEGTREFNLKLPQEQAVPLLQVGGPFLDLDITFTRGDSEVVGMLLNSWQEGGKGAASLLYTWETSTLQVIFEGVDPATQQPTTLAVGGALTAPQPSPDTLHLRVLLDHSVLEVFTGGGEVLTTRVYRGSPPPEQQQDAGIDFVAYGGAAAIARLEAHEMGSMWKEDAVVAGQSLSRAGSGLQISRL